MLSLHYHCVNIGLLRWVESVEVFISALMIAQRNFGNFLTYLSGQLNNPPDIIRVILANWWRSVAFNCPSDAIVDVLKPEFETRVVILVKSRLSDHRILLVNHYFKPHRCVGKYY